MVKIKIFHPIVSRPELELIIALASRFRVSMYSVLHILLSIHIFPAHDVDLNSY